MAATKVSATPRRPRPAPYNSYSAPDQADVSISSPASPNGRGKVKVKGAPAKGWRKVVVEPFGKSPELRRSSTQRDMATSSTRRRRDSDSVVYATHPSRGFVRDGRRRHEDEHPSRHQKSRRRSHDDEEILYGSRSSTVKVSASSRPPLSRRGTHGRESSRAANERPGPEGRERETSRRRPDKRSSQYRERERIPLRSEKRSISETVLRPARERPAFERSSSVRDRPQSAMDRPSIRRNQTSTRGSRLAHSSSPPSPHAAERIERVASVKRDRPTSFLGSIFSSHKAQAPSKPMEVPKPRASPRPAPRPEKQVECLTCMCEYPKSKTAHLPCDHRMCHSCLRRLFTLSVTDPQHMPPKCCTSEAINLKFVGRLFDDKFKKLWNQKHREFTTENRIYCPARGCGQWIKPSHIYTDTSGGANGGRKYARCNHCKTKVCCTCNAKWHVSRECPKDPATQAFIEMTKKEGWKRCYNCRATVELREGCNHMTCRCGAQFCMLCGEKWKTCNCAWFNQDAVDNDRVRNVNVRAAGPFNYEQELAMRREQERQDEAFARRMAAFGLVEDDDADDDDNQTIDYSEHGFGNGGVNFMNEHFVRRAQNILSGAFDPEAADRLIAEHRHHYRWQPQNTPPPPPNEPPPQPPRPQTYPIHQQPPHPREQIHHHQQNPRDEDRNTPPLRRHTPASRTYNQSPHTRPSERVIPARTGNDYHAEAARHRPYADAGPGPARASPDGEARRASMLAGITAGTGEGRVHEWMRHVIVGLEEVPVG